nr:helix-turn-helix domain-containing protein [Streptomyces griseoluteus]
MVPVDDGVQADAHDGDPDHHLTFAAWVRHERPLRIRRDLLDPAFADISTATIAARWGVHDTKHLGRSLKRGFGESVSDLRRKQVD